MSERVNTLQLTGHDEADVKSLQKFGTIDAFQDWSPPAASESTHIKSCMQALRVGGRISLMGGIRGDIPISYTAVMSRNLQIQGRWMYTKNDILCFIKMIQAGVMKPRKQKLLETFPLDRWREAFETAGEHTGHGYQILIAP